MNKGYTLAEVYHYLPSYIVFLVEYVPNFIIEVEEFERLPKPVKYSAGEGKFAQFIQKAHKGSLEIIRNSESKKLVEFDFKFPKKVFDILDAKRRNDYIAPMYSKAEEKRATLIDIKKLLESNS